MITSHSEPDLVGFRFERTIIENKVAVGHLATSRNFIFADEINSISRDNSSSNALGKTAKFIPDRFQPNVFVRSMKKLVHGLFLPKFIKEMIH